MKARMKKYILFVLMAMLLLCSACTPPMFYFSYDCYRDRVVKIELIEYDDPDIGKRPFRFFWDKKDDRDFQQEYCTVIETLPEEDIDAFLFEFDQEYTKHTAEKNAPSGQGVRITLANDRFFVCTWKEYKIYACFYDKNGKPTETGFGFSPKVYLVISANYFQTKIEQ